ncbi:MAG: hypothetical protein Q4G07_07705 [Oscillospiraceae bacterium]|nr:hypothetical protein [Oscillospiraceae bacterium]
MLQNCLLIILSGFGILGAYFLAEVISELFERKNQLPKAVVIFAPQDAKALMEEIVQARKSVPDSDIYICTEEPMDMEEKICMQLQGVYFVRPGQLGAALCAAESLQMKKDTV